MSHETDDTSLTVESGPKESWLHHGVRSARGALGERFEATKNTSTQELSTRRKALLSELDHVEGELHARAEKAVRALIEPPMPEGLEFHWHEGKLYVHDWAKDKETGKWAQAGGLSKKAIGGIKGVTHVDKRPAPWSPKRMAEYYGIEFDFDQMEMDVDKK